MTNAALEVIVLEFMQTSGKGSLASELLSLPGTVILGPVHLLAARKFGWHTFFLFPLNCCAANRVYLEEQNLDLPTAHIGFAELV